MVAHLLPLQYHACQYNHTSVHISTIVALQVASHKQILIGTELTVEVGYCSPKPQEECVLTVEGLPEMDAAVLKPALEWYFKQPANGGREVTSCDIIKGVAYIQFANPSGTVTERT